MCGCETYAKVLSVHDGDTLSLGICMRGMMDPLKFSCRLADIDTCELTSHDATIKKLALRAKERLQELTVDKLVWVRCHGLDKYGRLLVDLYGDKGDPKSFGDVLVEEGLACRYTGHEKKTTESQLREV